jgi:hypothetical protein
MLALIMDAQIIAAWITAGTTLFGALCYLLVERHKERSESSARQNATAALVTGSAEYRYRADVKVASARIINANGDVVFEYQVMRMTAPHGILVTSIDAAYTTSGNFDPVTPVQLSYSSRQDMELRSALPTPQKCEYSLMLSGGPTHDDEPCTFALKHNVSRCFSLEAAVIKERYKADRLRYEYHREVVKFPLNRLRIVVSFPQDFPRQTFANVTFGESEDVAVVERRRIENRLTQTSTFATLEVDDPKVGHSYMICWDGREPGH